MRGRSDIRHAALLSEIEAAVAELQPQLAIIKSGSEIELAGPFVLRSNEGPFDEYQVRILAFDGFPQVEPKVYETAGRIRRSPDLHVNSDGDCCLTVWEEWLVVASGTSFGDFLSGPVHEYFLNQWWFARTGRWRFGQRSHGARGIVEAYADVLGIQPIQRDVIYYLRLLSKDWPKGHWCCPCGCGIKLRNCHREELKKLHRSVRPKMASRMLRRLMTHLGPRRK